MNYKIQSIVMPTEVKHFQCRDMFYKGDEGYLETDKKILNLSKCQFCNLTTYLNACSYRKWKKYTNAGKLTVFIDVEGPIKVKYQGAHKDLLSIERTEFANIEYSEDTRRTISFEYPDNDEQMIGLEIFALGDVKIYGGYYSAEVDEESINDITLCIATTTMKKEEFIKKNIELLKKEILNSDEEIKNHFYVHVVDNGRTLTEEDINGEHISLHPNSNSGGAGGFARGMIESLNQKPRATHVLLMDDDVLMLPESIVRTYNMLKLMKKEYEKSFISGAMIYYETPFLQHEDIGTIDEKCFFISKKGQLDLRDEYSCLVNETELIRYKNEYAGWWYCCIPTKVIDEKGLPLPIFIRCDDMEYSLRCNANIITMNGICVWHMGFVTKYNAAFDKYQQCRNLLIDQAVTDGVLKDIDVYDFVFKSYRSELLKYNYNAAELVVKAIEDFSKGPEFLFEDRGEALVKENAKLNDKLVPLETLGDFSVEPVRNTYCMKPRSTVGKWLFRLTFNGQRFWNTRWSKKGLCIIPFDHAYFPGNMEMYESHLAVNPFNMTGIERKVDQARFKELHKRFKSADRYYRRHKNEIIKKYRNAGDYLKSERFWKKYLNI